MNAHAELLMEASAADRAAIHPSDEADRNPSTTVNPGGARVRGCNRAFRNTKVLTARRRLAAGRYDSDAFLDSALKRILDGLIP